MKIGYLGLHSAYSLSRLEYVIMLVPDSESYAMDLYKAFGGCLIAGSFQKYR